MENHPRTKLKKEVHEQPSLYHKVVATYGYEPTHFIVNHPISTQQDVLLDVKEIE